ncbi:hypothetical protein CANTEDRAFT_117364 [Yamadazyma tenuis ATCC 10573]|uniref:non-specific serine/threonine protein kinase n=1 Tax=Candida tenuis (strain ATCC 10573 / BCRC 21748 / CBS 615 / JCM 9827 / NBRC 10315 / NRRL Y-1498 / VKM Y-70) TaxID=590646 RepID=G3AW72_CANTC|nr:uncharacterized protein CANTEDRAFT_117364 [Yamadazyma tenuis ATCC 10573]EGV66470.1 hypothetical protein CANTEDRAFT_117364 [Yamadazyma tenuis ATCC 10573]
MSLRDHFNTKNDILKFPVESTHSYSYAHLSPNSLALRLNVLRRSLQILRDRPALISAINNNVTNDKFHEFKNTFNYSMTPLSRQVSSDSASITQKSNLQTNASSAALAALFRPSLQRSDSFPVDEIYSKTKSKTPNTKVPENQVYSDDMTDIIELLEMSDSNISKNKDFASTLHDLSLNQDNHKLKHAALKSKLMYALSTPFVDTTVMTTSGTDSGAMSPIIHPSTLALNLLSNNQGLMQPSTSPNPVTGQGQFASNHLANSNRPYHSISSGKHALPQSIFTIDCDSPWSVKAANDLACLMFGVSKNMIKSLTLMDLIAPQFREFVTDRITRCLSGLYKIQTVLPNTEIIFAGEIVAISRPGDKGYAWTSIWAKKRGNLIIFMFDQIPCDAFDVVIRRDLNNVSQSSDFEVVSKRTIAGNLAWSESCQYANLSDISETMAAFINESLQQDLERYVSVSGEVSTTLTTTESERLNSRRYFTLRIDNENIPCAVTSNPIDIHRNTFEMKLKIHSLPYIAGIFVIDSQSLRLVSCNNAIARNLFGWSSIDLVGQSIDCIVSDFSHIFHCGLNDTSSDFSVVPGLVLPDHFFRRYSCVYKATLDPTYDAATQFIGCKGLTAKHMDGSEFFIDIQLRVSALDTYVLWVTYSRQTYQPRTAEDGDNTKSNPDTGSLNSLRPVSKRVRSMSGDETPSGFTSLPSQLSLFDKGQALLTVTGDIVRHKSTRNPKPSGRVGKKTSLDPGTRGSSTHSTSTHDDSVLSEMANSSVNTCISSIVDEYDEPTPEQFTTSSSPFFGTKAQQDQIAHETAQIEANALACSNWPSEIGVKRRSKKIDEFKVVRDMGEGAYGKVILAQHNTDKAYEIIIKCIDKEKILVDTWVRDRKLGTIPSEIQIMATLMSELHPSIMRIVDFFEDEQYYYLETPIFGNPPGIDLFDYIEIRKDMTEVECQFIFKQIASAVFHLHKHGIVHRDIKDENVIVDERGIIKLIDFGSAGYTKSGPFDVFVGTIDYASPEVLRGEKYDGKPQDIWALGILLYTILYKENPFYNVDEIMEGDLRLPGIVSDGAINLIKKILVRPIDSRPTITDVLEDDWLQ